MKLAASEGCPCRSGYNEAWFLNVNPDTAHPFMLDVNVRKAIALATDRFTIVKDLLVAEINPVNATYWDMTPPYDSTSSLIRMIRNRPNNCWMRLAGRTRMAMASAIRIDGKWT